MIKMDVAKEQMETAVNLMRDKEKRFLSVLGLVV